MKNIVERFLIEFKENGWSALLLTTTIIIYLFWGDAVWWAAQQLQHRFEWFLFGHKCLEPEPTTLFLII